MLPLFDRADTIDILAAFVQESGLDRIRPAQRSALGRGAHIRVVTGDYLDITQASALEMLLDWFVRGFRGIRAEAADQRLSVGEFANSRKWKVRYADNHGDSELAGPPRDGNWIKGSEFRKFINDNP